MSDQSRAAVAPADWADPVIAVPRAATWRRALPLLAWLGCLGVAIGLLLVLGDGRLAAPSLTAPGTWAAWARDRDPVEVAMVVARLLGLALSWYLVGVTTVSVLARVLRAARLVRLADALSVGPVRVLVQQTLGVGLATGVLVAVVPAVPTGSTAHTPSAAAEVEVLAPRSAAAGGMASVSVARQTAPAEEEVEVLAPIPAPPPTAAPPTAATSPTAAPSPTAPPPARVAPPAVSGTHATLEQDGAGATTIREVRVQPGDHFWGIAERDVSAYLGRPATDAEVAAHWRVTVAANRDRLRVPDNPDLLLPGQVVVLPGVGQGGAP